MNCTRLRWPLAGVLIVLAAGCGDNVAPAGSPSTVTVHAFVDVDGSGNRSPGDVPIVGATVTLEPNDGGAALQATTDAQGTATFSSVPPGSHRAKLAGNVPGGAVLATASEPIVVTDYRGGAATAQFRFVFNPGEIVGRLFRDNNNNNQFDPGIDTPAPGIPVELFAGASASGDPIAQTTTDQAGAFRFTTLRAGHYTYRFSPLPTMQITGGASATVTVEPATPLQLGVRWTGNLIVPIGQARQAAPGTVVAVEGVVTAGVGIFSTNATSNQFNVQDATAGVLVLQVPLASGIQTGDSVRVVGTVQVSAGELVLTSNPTVSVLASNRSLPAPRVVTAAQVAAHTATDPAQGSLVSVSNVRVDSVGAGAAGYNVFVTGAAGGSFIVRVSTQAIAPQSFWQVGRVYNVTGTLSQFNGAQVKIRSQADVTTGSLFPTILQVRRGGTGQTVTVEGVVTAGTGVFSVNATSNQFNVQDATAGVLVLQVPLAAGIQLGDSVRVTGTTQVSSGEFVITGNPTVTRLAQNRPVPPPLTVTAQHVAASTAPDTIQGRLVRVQNVRIDSVGGGAAGYNVFATGSAGGSFIIRVSLQSIAPQSFWQVGSSYDVVGALSNFNGAQVKVRSAADIGLAGTLPLAIGQARLQPAGTNVTVTGVVTAGVGIFSTNATSNQFNVQDPTGGVLVLQVPLASGIALGDSVRVTGNTAVSAGEFVITGNPTVTLISAGRPVPAPISITAQYAAASTATDPLQGTLVRVQNVRVDSLGAGATAYNVFVTGQGGGSFIVRVGTAATNVTRDMWAVGQSYHVTGTLASFNGAQIKVRSASDVASASAGGVVSSNVNAMPHYPFRAARPEVQR